MLTSLVVDAIHEANIADGKRSKAFDTMFRHSDAGKCARQLGFAALGYEETEPMDLAGVWGTWLGRTIHEEWQKCLLETYPDAEVEVKVRFDDTTSGHLDALITTPEGVKICYELKTMGSFGFDKATGLMRKTWSRKAPEGPRLTAIIQGSLNALASGADVLVIGVIGLEAMSKGYADKVGASELDRIMAEWHYSREEFEPIALSELDRLAEIKGWLDAETLPPRWGIDDSGRQVEFDPENTQFPCGYCSHKSLCRYAGAGPIPLPIPGLKEWIKEDA
jgi:hypothetical protein